ncbi:hypothetical protein NC653_034225 [Populus alba x Populus x berolinensis]|uniref:Uncharacterized protein n=1 Tax=Populus alba x Populus x berolinensis TaxID=444605 RepID=A0AAD6PVZ7_9ROSI|nr:hypothetical protein NC653_034225 [Populus alba x Populus x berolinensis]
MRKRKLMSITEPLLPANPVSASAKSYPKKQIHGSSRHFNQQSVGITQHASTSSTFVEAQLEDAVFKDTIAGYIDLKKKICANTSISPEMEGVSWAADELKFISCP